MMTGRPANPMFVKVPMMYQAEGNRTVFWPACVREMSCELLWNCQWTGQSAGQTFEEKLEGGWTLKRWERENGEWIEKRWCMRYWDGSNGKLGKFEWPSEEKEHEGMEWNGRTGNRNGKKSVKNGEERKENTRRALLLSFSSSREELGETGRQRGLVLNTNLLLSSALGPSRIELSQGPREFLFSNLEWMRMT